MNDVVNILVPFYNNEDTLKQTLSSVEAQTCSDWKVILIDDGSTDSSGAIAETFIQNNPGKAIILQSDRPQAGPAIGRNAGLRRADGLYVMCLDSDDSLTPFCIEQRASVMRQEPELHWAVFNQYECGPGAIPPYPVFNRPVKTREAAIGVFLKMDVAWQTMAPIWKTETLVNLGGFDETLYPSEDPDLHLRALLDNNINVKICFNLPADCYYNVHRKAGDKLLLFYSQSIRSKFKLLKKIAVYLANGASIQTSSSYNRLLRRGFFNFYNTFLLARIKEYQGELKEMIFVLREKRVLSATDILRLRMLTAVFISNSPVIGKLRLKGLIHKFFLSVK